MRKQLVLLFLVLIGFVLPLAAQNRGSDEGGGAREVVDARGEIVAQFTESHALVIGECEYKNGWRRLPGAKDDVAKVKKLFEEQGFNVETIEDANSRNLRSGITNFLDKYAFNPNARILLYFAGHGATVDLGDGRIMGYIVPIDAPLSGNNSNFLQAAIPMNQFEAWARQYTSRHILFIFDSCFAGTVFRSQGSAPPAINRLIGQPVRQFITSGTAKEEVPDVSIFRKELEFALRDAAADSNKDGYVSGTELGLYLYDKVSNNSNGKQNPTTGKLKDTDLDKGDFIFLVSSGGLSGGINPPLPRRPEPKQDPTPDPKPGTAEFFIGTWVATMEYNNSFDKYRITFFAPNRCEVEIENDTAQQVTTGHWSFNSNTNRLTLDDVVFRNAKITYQKNIKWISQVGYTEDNNTFHILARAAANDSKSQVQFKFFRE